MPAETVRLKSCASTMDEARRLAHEGAPDGTLVVAEEMAAGRGRHGRTWTAPLGGLYLSLVVRDLEDPRLLTLALGCAVADTLEVAGVEPQVKWVNDVWVEGRKAAGILVEAESTGDHVDFLVAGIGVNVNGGRDVFPDDVRRAATTLEAELGAEQCIPDLEAVLLGEVRRYVDLLRAGRGGDVLAAWRARDMLKGSAVRVDTGDQVLEGTADGIDDRGHLLVEIGDGGVIAVENGTVQVQAT